MIPCWFQHDTSKVQISLPFLLSGQTKKRLLHVTKHFTYITPYSIPDAPLQRHTKHRRAATISPFLHNIFPHLRGLRSGKLEKVKNKNTKPHSIEKCG